MPDIPVSIRLNPYKACSLPFTEGAEEVPWSPYGLYLPSRPSFTLDPHFHAGAYYVQDASAMFVGYALRCALDRFGGRKVLDLCAAPGGKSTDAAASLRERFGSGYVLVSNEVIRARASVLQDNLALWGDPNVVVTSSDARAFAAVKGYFDVVIADVPCSGEGMFRKSAAAREMWSEDNVALCAARARRIVADVWDSLAPGGILVFSTCTLNDEENDGNAAWICETLGASEVDFGMPFEGPVRKQYGYLLEPGVVRGEGQYCALLRKDGGREEACYDGGREEACPDGTAADGPLPVEDTLEFFERGDSVLALPRYLSAQMGFLARKVNILSAGTCAFTLKGRDRIPCADLALSLALTQDDFPMVEISREDALRFLHKDALRLPDAPTGYVAVTYDGLPLGFVKNLGTRANNLHPASRRILMNVEGK